MQKRNAMSFSEEPEEPYCAFDNRRSPVASTRVEGVTVFGDAGSNCPVMITASYAAGHCETV